MNNVLSGMVAALFAMPAMALAGQGIEGLAHQAAAQEPALSLVAMVIRAMMLAGANGAKRGMAAVRAGR